jgi:hypothetical protein
VLGPSRNYVRVCPLGIAPQPAPGLHEAGGWLAAICARSSRLIWLQKRPKPYCDKFND